MTITILVFWQIHRFRRAWNARKTVIEEEVPRVVQLMSKSRADFEDKRLQQHRFSLPVCASKTPVLFALGFGERERTEEMLQYGIHKSWKHQGWIGKNDDTNRMHSSANSLTLSIPPSFDCNSCNAFLAEEYNTGTVFNTYTGRHDNFDTSRTRELLLYHTAVTTSRAKFTRKRKTRNTNALPYVCMYVCMHSLLQKTKKMCESQTQIKNKTKMNILPTVCDGVLSGVTYEYY